MGPQIVSPITVSFDLSISNTFGQNFLYYSLGTDGEVGTNIYFYSGGAIYVFDSADSIYHPAGSWKPGSYHHVRIEKDFCNHRSISYYFDDALIYQTSTDATKTIQRAVMQSDNGGSGGDFVDVDNYSVVRAAVPCVAVCGNGIVEAIEDCEPGVPGTCPPGRCIPVGQPGACTCASVCASGEACDDGVECTVDTCGNNTCVHTATNSLCDDHKVCNGSETCDAKLGCRPGTTLDCNDHNACTTDTCTEPNGCGHAAVNCDNGQFCDGVETCDPAVGCVPGTPPHCDDGFFCNGQETCTASGCARGTPPCATNQTCNEQTNTCTNAFTAIPTVSQWGLIVMALIILIIVKVRNLRSIAMGR